MPPLQKPLQEPKPGQSSKQGYKFLKAADVRQSLRNQNEATLIEALTALRNQLTIKPSEDAFRADDERLLLVKSWLDTDPGVQDVFELWDRTNTRQVAQLSLVLSVLSSVIALLSTHYTYHTYASTIIRTILSPQWSSKLNSYLSTTHNELLLVTLKLYNNLSAFAGGRERRAVLDVFPWELKTLPKLLHMRRRSKGDDDVDVLARPDIRTLYVLFLLSFVNSTTSTAVKAAFLDQRRDALSGVFKGLPQDAHTVVRRVLECCWTGIWCDPKIKRTAKINLFNEQTVQQILRLYDRNVPEGEDQESVPADIAHHFLLAICTRPGTGICFKDRGWYPREDEDQPVVEAEEEGGRRQNVKIYNKILAGILKTLKVNEDARQQELALRILAACPELVSGYWHAAALTLEPRLSSKWIANIAFFGLVISQPVPHASFIMPGSDLYRPAPPALSTILENVLPSVNIKAHLSRGLQAAVPLVQHCAALALAKALTKFGAVVASLRDAAAALEEDEDEGQWSRRLREVEREAARRVPDFQVVVAFGQQKTTELQAAKEQGAVTKAALLAESAQRLLWLYHEHLPSLVAETRFDVAKLLQGIQESEALDEGAVAPHPGLVAMRQLHILRLLRESEDFSWSGKTGSRGNLSILLRLYIHTSQRPMKSAVANLLRQTLSTTAAFQHDPEEVDLWLRALPRTRRFAGAAAPDGTPLTDEGAAVLALLDDCLQRCIRTPYRYLEELQALCAPTDADAMAVDSNVSAAQDPAQLPSPMLVTVLEQVSAKVNGNHVSPSDALAIVSFVRKLATGLASKVADLGVVDAIAKRLDALSLDEAHYGESVRTAVCSECELLKATRKQLTTPAVHEAMEADGADLEELLSGLRELVGDSAELHEEAAFEAVDLYRFMHMPTSGEQFNALLSTLEELHKPAAAAFVDFVFPAQGVVWGSEDLASRLSNLQCDFTTLFMHADIATLASPPSRSALVQALPGANTVDAKWALRLVDHRLVSTEPSDAGDLLHLLSECVQKIMYFNNSALLDVLQFLFKLPGVQRIFRSALPASARPGLVEFLKQTVRSKDAAEQDLISEFTAYWDTALRQELITYSDDLLQTSLLWLEVMSTEQMLVLLDHFAMLKSDERASQVLEALMDILSRSVERSDVSGLLARLPSLLQLQSSTPGWEKVIAIALDGYLPSFYDGRSITSSSSATLSDLVSESSSRWSALGHEKHPVDVRLFLEQPTWSDLTASIVSRLTYSQASARATIRDWFRSGGWQGHPPAHTVSVLRALLDTCHPLSPFVDEDEEALVSLCKSACKELLAQRSEEAQKQCQFCVETIVDMHPSVRALVSEYLESHMKKLADRFNSALFSLAIHVDAKGSLGAAAIGQGLKWATSTLSAGESAFSGLEDGLEALGRGLEVASPKAHYTEAAVTAAIQNHLGDVNVVRFVQSILERVQFKPVNVNRFIQNVIQHPKFQALAGPANAENKDVRDSLTNVLRSLFHAHPVNTCQPSHVEPLLAAYGGTMSVADRHLLSIFQLFETTRKASVSTLLARWSPAADASCTTPLEAIHHLDPARTMKTCLAFPQYYAGPLGEDVDASYDERLYDPVFVMLLFSRVLVDSVPETALAWVQMFRTNVVSLVIRALSSHREEVRTLAITQLAGLYSILQNADMQEQPHVVYVLELLKNIYSDDSPEQPPRIPAYTTLHLAHALRGVFYPATFTYPLTSRFLLQRHEFDVNDVPLLYSTLYSAGDQWKKERTWIVRFLAEGMVGRQEWRVLKRRHTWDLLATMFQSESHDQTFRRNVLEVLASLTCNKAAATSLVLGSGLLSWIEMQVQTVSFSEGLAWVRILENITAVLDIAKIEASTAGEWRSILSRTLLRLLNGSVCETDVLVHVVGIIQRLSSTAPVPTELDILVAQSLLRLEALEKGLQLESSPASLSAPKAPHSPSGLWQPVDGSTLSLWGFCVETLWRAAMSTDERSAAWDALTSRLLLWRSLAGDASQIGEWARREVVRNLSS
ncbi:ribosome 60S biogenesis N-terminal-domain-containing protein [Phanerochaete sordida]|uniref:Ribosome 60S biogenesis N-terminal-domain-containing protein n=1 Tax=Phanerochaete sordida TaxID=48140 RepID=A0A9P3GQW8_9APHY|nr:ribosome 60S biogenesis N-terminal-domain-containing protein [Phanerochaete sordida]